MNGQLPVSFLTISIFFDHKRRKWIYRGIAYGDGNPCRPAAAWEAVMGTYDRVEGDTVLYFAGKSTIENCYEYHPEAFQKSVFIILRFTGSNRFKGAGFDFEWSARGDGARDSFPIEGERVDPEYLQSHNVSDGLLEQFSISPADRNHIFRFSSRGSMDSDAEG